MHLLALTNHLTPKRMKFNDVEDVHHASVAKLLGLFLHTKGVVLRGASCTIESSHVSYLHHFRQEILNHHDIAFHRNDSLHQFLFEGQRQA